MTVEEPIQQAKGVGSFKDFHQACLWAKELNMKDFILPSTAIGENVRDDATQNTNAWDFLTAVEKVITENWCLLIISRNQYQKRSGVMYYDKTRNWLVSFQSENDFTKLEPLDINQGLKVIGDPHEAFLQTFGPMGPLSKLTTSEVSKWYDQDGDFLYGEEVNYIKHNLRHFIFDDEASPYLVKIDLPLDHIVRTINYFFKVFQPR